MDVTNSIQFVVTSTGVTDLTSNGTGNEWALFGLPALQAAKHIQARLKICLHSSQEEGFVW